MTDKVTRLVNILQDKFEVPDRTNGLNIMRDKLQILASVNNYWQMDGNYSMEDFNEALSIVDIPNFVNTQNTRIYIITEK